jgi:hypothetical protein
MNTQDPGYPDSDLRVTTDDAPAPLAAAVAGTLTGPVTTPAPGDKPGGVIVASSDSTPAATPSASAAPAGGPEKLILPGPKPMPVAETPTSAMPAPVPAPPPAMAEAAPRPAPDAAAAAQASRIAPASGGQTAMLTEGPPKTKVEERMAAAADAPATALPAMPPPQAVQEVAANAAIKTPRPKGVTATPVGDYAVQFGAVSDGKRALTAAAKLQKQLASVLGGRTVKVLKAEIKGKGTIYRIRAEGYKSRQLAQAACQDAARLKVQPCVPMKR